MPIENREMGPVLVAKNDKNEKMQFHTGQGYIIVII